MHSMGIMLNPQELLLLATAAQSLLFIAGACDSALATAKLNECDSDCHKINSFHWNTLDLIHLY